MSTAEQKARRAAASRERWNNMPPERRERRLAQLRAYRKAKYKPKGTPPGNLKGTRRVSFNKNDRYQYVLAMKFERGECADCGWQIDIWNHACMEWDHRVPADKEFTLSSAWKYGHMTKEKLRREADKCDLVCANCHRLRTYWGRDHDHRNEPTFVQDDQLRLFDEQ